MKKYPPGRKSGDEKRRVRGIGMSSSLNFCKLSIIFENLDETF